MNGLISLVLVFFALFLSLTFATHPFVGNYETATSVERDDGTLAMRLTKKQLSFSKYETVIDRKLCIGPTMTGFGYLTETVFGKSERKQQFELSVIDSIEQRRRDSSQTRRLGDRHVSTELETIGGAMWTGTVYMGRFTPMDVVLDTGSDWLVVESHHCTNCEGNRYDVSSSRQVGEEISSRIYGSAQLEGIEYTDTVCFMLTTCVANFEFFAIYNQTGIKEPIDGILGLARDKWFYQSQAIDENLRGIGPLFLLALHEKSYINEKTFSFYFDGQ